MAQVSSIFRRGPAQYFHWCPACKQTHPLPDSWTFNGDLEKPTFTPSFRQMQIRNKDGVVLGDCHYFVTDGKINFCGDSWHLRTDSVEIPKLPDHISDEDISS